MPLFSPKLSFEHQPLPWRSALFLSIAFFILSWIAVRIGLHTAFWYQGFDEPLKGQQVWEGEYRLNHPPMMVWLAHLLGTWTGTLNSYGDGVFWAREVVAFFGAVGMTALAMLAMVRRGIWVALVSLGLILCLGFFQYHVRVAKEEPLLFAGFALFALAVAWREDKRSVWSAAILGLATAFALSTKYVGVLVLPFSLAALFLLPREGKRAVDFAFWLVALLAGCLLFLAPAWLNLEQTMEAFEDEFEHMTETKKGVEEDLPWINPDGFRKFWSRLGGDKHFGYLFFVLGIGAILLPNWVKWKHGWFSIQQNEAKRTNKNKRAISIAEVCLLTLTVLFPVVIMFSNFYSNRYQVSPRSLATYVLACGFCWVASFVWRQFREKSSWQLRVASGVMLLLLLYYTRDQVRRSGRHYRGVTTNHRMELAQWIGQNLPKDAVILLDNYGRMPNLDQKRLREAKPLYPQTTRFLGGDPAKIKAKDMREAGITHIVLTRQGTERKMKNLNKDDDQLNEKKLRQKRFYTLLKKQEILWQQRYDNKRHLYSSGIYLIELPEEALLELK